MLGEFFRGRAAGGLCWASFFAEEPLEGLCWASIFADRQSWDPAGRVVLRRSPGRWPSTGSVNPSKRS